jgi:CubicO group peptidase (beta-lactamase class C family)
VTRRWGRDPFPTGLVQAVEGAARQATATSTTPGLSVALVHHGQQVWAAGYGVADRMICQPVTAATRFQAASLSKPVTAWGMLRLVESGRIGLDEPIIGRLRRWRPPPSPFDAEGITVRRLLSHTAGLSVHGYVGQTPDRALSSIASSLSGETGDGFPVELLEAPGRGWLYSGGGYSLLQLLMEELTGHPFADYMQAQVLKPLGMTASSFRWSRTAHTARPHDTDGRPIPDFAFAEQAAAGLVTTAPDLACFLGAALAGPRGEPPGRGVLSPAGVRLALTAAPATDGRWGLGYGLGLPRAVTGSPTTRAPTAAGGPAWPCCPTGAGIVLLANGDAGSGPIDAVVQQWIALTTPNPKYRRLRAAMLAIPAVAAVTALGLAARRRTQVEGWRPPGTLTAFATAVRRRCRPGPGGRGGARPGSCPGGRPGSPRRPG